MDEIERMGRRAARIYEEWLRDRSTARPYAEYRRERGLDEEEEPSNKPVTECD